MRSHRSTRDQTPHIAVMCMLLTDLDLAVPASSPTAAVSIAREILALAIICLLQMIGQGLGEVMTPHQTRSLLEYPGLDGVVCPTMHHHRQHLGGQDEMLHQERAAITGVMIGLEVQMRSVLRRPCRRLIRIMDDLASLAGMRIRTLGG